MAIKKLCIPFVNKDAIDGLLENKDAIDELVNTIVIQDGEVGTYVEVTEPAKIKVAVGFTMSQEGVWLEGITSATTGPGFADDTGAPYADLFIGEGKFQTVDWNGGYYTGVRINNEVLVYQEGTPVEGKLNVQGDIQVSTLPTGITYEPGSSTKVFKAFKLED